MLILPLSKETSFLLLIKIPLDHEELPGGPSLPLRRKRNKRDPKILDSLEVTNLRLKENSIDIATKFSISLTLNSLSNQAMLKLKSSITKWKEIIIDTSLNTPLELNIIKLEIMPMKLTNLPLKKLRKTLKQPTQLDSVLPSTTLSSTIKLRTTQAKPVNWPNKPLMMPLLILIKSNKINTKTPPQSCN